VRVELANPGLRIKPGMFAQVELQGGARTAVLTVPLSALIDSGARQVVLVQVKPGHFEPREVKTGVRSDDAIEILRGVQEGEAVVVAANFLIDAESNLKAAIGGFAPPPAAATSTPAASGHQAHGTVEELDAKAATLSIAHGPVASLKWPAMTMEFTAANATLLQDLKPGAMVDFEFVERAPGEWVITRIGK